MEIAPLAVQAEARIHPHVRETPIERSAALSELAGCDVLLKLENFQVTGSFKIRGILSKLLSLEPEELAGGAITASTGNHGLASAHAAGLLGVSIKIVLPETANPWRVDCLKAAGADLCFHGRECAEAEAWAREEAARTGRLYIPPYNDPVVVAGQGTISLELMREPARMDVLVAAVGGGGLISGTAAVIKERGLSTSIVGCVPENSPAMYDSVRAGHIVAPEVRPTRSDSTAGNIEPGALTFELCRRLVDHWALVSEDDILMAMRLVLREHGMLIEGAAGVAVAGFLGARDRIGLNADSTVVIIVCGGNVSPDDFRDVVS